MNQKIKYLIINKLQFIYLWDIRILIVLTISFSSICSYALYKGYVSEYEMHLCIEQSDEYQLNEEVIQYSAIIESISLFKNKLIELDALDKSLNEKFFVNGDVSSIIVLLNEIIENSDLSIVTINAESDGEVLKNNIWFKPINISLQGSSKSLSNLIYELTKSKKIMQTNEMKITRVNDDMLDIHMVISIFYLRK